DVAADLQRGFHLGVLEGLAVGVDTHEFHAINAGGHHVGHGVAAPTPDPDHLDDGALAVRVHQFKHGLAPYTNTNGWLSRSLLFMSLSASKNSPGTRTACARAPSWHYRPGSARDGRAKRCHVRRATAPRRWNRSGSSPRRKVHARPAGCRGAPA